MTDLVNHPPHYTAHPSGVECIDITEHMGFCLGNAVKYIWRADLKDNAVEDLRKAAFYIDREIERRTNGSNQEERLRESEFREHRESKNSSGTTRTWPETDYKKGSLLASKHLL